MARLDCGDVYHWLSVVSFHPRSPRGPHWGNNARRVRPFVRGARPSRRGTTYQLTPYRHGATALTDRLTRNSSWSSAGLSRRGEGSPRGSRERDRGRKRERPSLIRSRVLVRSRAVSSSLLCTRPPSPSSGGSTYPGERAPVHHPCGGQKGGERNEHVRLVKSEGRRTERTKGRGRGRSAKAGIWGRGCKICCRNGVANECGRPVD